MAVSLLQRLFRIQTIRGFATWQGGNIPGNYDFDLKERWKRTKRTKNSCLYRTFVNRDHPIFSKGATAQCKHSVWKSQKKYHSTLQAKRTTFTFWVDKNKLKMPKMVHFGEFLKTWSLRSNSVTRQVTFKRTKNWWKIPKENTKIEKIKCDILSNF